MTSATLSDGTTWCTCSSDPHHLDSRGTPVPSRQPVVLIADALSPATVAALGDGFDVLFGAEE